ncbi:hypothetical protein ABZU25_21605 [Micromonospora sp. NPDC005215]|uniref:hypothetical protein n=1 Tax=Micromonospora sp. NPDC005215 TaxID=3157024 RepID=UPI0033B72083
MRDHTGTEPGSTIRGVAPFVVAYTIGSLLSLHVGRAMAKLGARDRLQTVVWAYQNGVARP